MRPNWVLLRPYRLIYNKKCTLFRSTYLYVRVVPNGPRILSFRFLYYYEYITPIKRYNVSTFLISICPFRLFISGNGNKFRFSLFFLHRPMITHDLHRTIGGKRKKIFPFHTPSLPRSRKDSTIRNNACILLFINNRQLMVSSTIFRLVRRFINEIRNLTYDIRTFLTFILLPLRDCSLYTRLLGFHRLFIRFIYFRLILFR